jgi:predicted amidohydrolase
MTDPWLPDYVARWYDEFNVNWPYGDIFVWQSRSTPIVNTWRPRLLNAPHAAAVELDKFITEGTSFTVDERRYHALRSASLAFQEVGLRWGIKRRRTWKSILSHWFENGNLLREVDGHLLPREPLPHLWAADWEYPTQPHSMESHFKDFVRWKPSDNPKYTIKVSVIPPRSLTKPGDALRLHSRLRIAVIPLVASKDDFNLHSEGEESGFPRFSMTLKDPSAVGSAALEAFDASAKEDCDIVVFPELCLTPEIQNSLRDRLATHNGLPWLVVAGSARTPVSKGGVTGHYNQSLVFNYFSDQELVHHKQHQYEMDFEQQEKYGLLEAFGQMNRREDMVVEPFGLEILDTYIGRIAVLICEDLSVEDFVKPLVVKFGLDWLFVPVLDGCQMSSRWTAKFGVRYAEHGACVVVATSLSLAQQHLVSIGDTTRLPGVGTVVLPFSPKNSTVTTGSAGRITTPSVAPPWLDDPVKILESVEHNKPVYIDFLASEDADF